MESYNHAYTTHISFFQTCWREADMFSLCSKNIRVPAFDLSTSSIISVSFYVVSNFTFIKLQAFPSRATMFTLLFTQSLLSLYSLSSFFPFSIPLCSISNTITINNVVINRGILISFVLLFYTPAFEARCSFDEFPVKNVLGWAGVVVVQATKEIMFCMKVKVWRRKSALKMSQFWKRKNLRLRELGAEQICQVSRAFLAVYMYALRDCRIQELCFPLFRKWVSRVTLLNNVRFLQLVLHSSQAKAPVTNKVSLTTAF